MRSAWPDWTGRTACVIAAGATARETVSRMPGRPPTIVVNRSYELASWADILYAADGTFWFAYPDALDFAGIKATADEKAALWHNLERIRVDSFDCPGPLRWPTACVGHGGHSGYQAINLAAQFNPRRIVLIGFDLVGSHWHPDHAGELVNPSDALMQRWRFQLDRVADTYAAWGVEILNASPTSSLTAYRRVDIEDAFTEDNGHGCYSGGSRRDDACAT